MKLGQIRTPEDVYDWMDENIQYGWLDTENGQHIGEMKNFRKSYRTMSLEEILEYRFGTCIEQVALMKFLLDKIRVENKMFCCRIYEPDDYGNLEDDEHMSCFIGMKKSIIWNILIFKKREYMSMLQKMRQSKQS